MRRFRLVLLAAAACGSIAAASPPAAPPQSWLTPFEQQRHAQFLEQARSQPIDLLFLGDSAVEFWLAEGKAQWQKHFAGLNAANFGVQGADTRSLLWRLQNGELERFNARVVVLDAVLAAGNPADGASRESEVLAGNDSLIAEIRKRQPDARILLLVAPRNRSVSLQAALRRHFAALAEGSVVTYLDVTEAFTADDGRFDSSFGSGRGTALSAQGYAALAETLGPAVRELLRRD